VEPTTTSSTEQPTTTQNQLPTTTRTSITISTTSTRPTTASTSTKVSSIRTTFGVPTSYFDPQATPTDDGNPVSSDTAVSAASRGFWANKSAVAGTFTVVSLIIAGIVGGATLMIIRRRKQLAAEQDEYYEKYESSIHGGSGDDGMSQTHITSPADPSAYPDRGIHYGDNTHGMHADMYPEHSAASEPYHLPDPAQDPFGQQHAVADVYQPSGSEQYPSQEYIAQEYDVGYPPGTAYAVSQGQDGQYQYSGYEQEQPEASSSQPHPFSDPSNQRTLTSSAPPVAFRGVESRGSGYQQSIDSFYGASAQ